jgi:hypothetical protein
MPNEVERHHGPRKITDLAEFAADYIDELRGAPAGGPRGQFLDYAYRYFSANHPSAALLEALTLMFVDRLYRLSSELLLKDVHVLAYVETVTRYVLDVARARGVRIFYILDNEIRPDRFDLALELMEAAGISTVTPYAPGGGAKSVDDVCAELDFHLLAGRHVAYMEKDASVDYLKPVIDLAATTDAYVVFRNEVPTLSLVRQIRSRRRATASERRAPASDD